MRQLGLPEFQRWLVEPVGVGRAPADLTKEVEPTAETTRRRVEVGIDCHWDDAGRDEERAGGTRRVATGKRAAGKGAGDLASCLQEPDQGLGGPTRAHLIERKLRARPLVLLWSCRRPMDHTKERPS
jgi:hypothetical protein